MSIGMSFAQQIYSQVFCFEAPKFCNSLDSFLWGKYGILKPLASANVLHPKWGFSFLSSLISKT
jgi:hypothetical protein